MFRSKAVPLSVDDIKSGRFEILAETVRAKWPFKARPTREEALDIVAKSLGYKDFDDATNSATVTAVVCLSIRSDVSSRFTKLGYAPAEPRFGSAERPFDMSSIFDGSMFLENKAAHDFVEEWPLDLISRWNYAGAPAIFGGAFLSEQEELFDFMWMYDTKESNGFYTATTSRSAGTVVAAVSGGISYQDLNGMVIGDLIDPEMSEALLQDVMPMVIGRILTVNEADAQRLTEETGMSMQDLWRLPRTESNFPSLYHHMRKRMKDDLLGRPVLDLYQAKRGDNGFYYFAGDIDHRAVKVTEEVLEGFFDFAVESNYLESEVFRSYSCVGQLRNKSGDVLSQVSGRYVAGPARLDVSGMDFISALDEVCDDDVEVGDNLLTMLQNQIFAEVDELLEKSYINTRMIFGYGNLFILSNWERSERAEKGVGIKLLEYCIGQLKKKYKRNICIAGLIEPNQYLGSAGSIGVVAEQCQKDRDKIWDQLRKVGRLPYVFGMHAASRSQAEGPSTFSRYCGESYGDLD
ncbi:hypothetical protein [Pseudomonas aeruginosa]|uniref:hypothetical protein n=1 Tax=Pseudomonas aeruginosa TaxID=287 RepID=UPI000B62329F|nr:hypothetical protein [Pseudomonas aeruginosa]ASJ88800.1 hypothetical protein PSA83_06674 [Pseudomonas aeruginosa]ELN4740311.1 hypothetical protein [Escherichia coli]